MEKIHIEKGSVQETLIVPLYARKLCAEQFPSLYQDDYAAMICDRLDYDFSQFRKKKTAQCISSAAWKAPCAKRT